MRTTWSAFAVALLVLALGACGGKSSEEKAQDTVCTARDNIGKQVDELASLTPATITKDAVTKNVTTIKNDLQDISGAQSELSSSRRSEVEAATKEFTSSVKQIGSQLGSSLSAADAKAGVVTALQQVEASYKKAFAPLDCG
jgi:hypothetical protein